MEFFSQPFGWGLSYSLIELLSLDYDLRLVAYLCLLEAQKGLFARAPLSSLF
jgi:hypothetical protein